MNLYTFMGDSAVVPGVKGRRSRPVLRLLPGLSVELGQFEESGDLWDGLTRSGDVCYHGNQFGNDLVLIVMVLR